MRKPWSLVAVIAFAVACGGSSKKPMPVVVTPDPPVDTAPPLVEDKEPALPDVPSAPAAAPEDLVATAVVGDARALLASVGAYADTIQPGVSAMITMDALVAGAADGGLDLHGADLTKPIRVLVLNPDRFHQPFVAVLAVGDAQALTAAAEEHGMRVMVHGGLAAVGTYDALVEAGGFALTTLADAPLPANPTLDVDVAYLVGHYGNLLEGVLGQAAQNGNPDQRATIEATMKMYLSLFRQIDRVQMTLEVVGDHASVVTRMRALPDTSLAAFIGKQAPATFGLIEQAPPGLVVGGGYLDLQLMWDSMGEMMEPIMASTYGDAAPTVMAFWKQWVALETGENAISMDLSAKSFGMSALWSVAQPAAVTKVLADYFKAIEKTPIASLAVKYTTSAYHGVKLWQITSAPGKDLPPEQRVVFDRMGGQLTFNFGTVGKQLLFTFGTDSAARTKALIDRAKGKKAAVAPTLAAVLADARARKESYLLAFDIAAIKERFEPSDATGNGPGAAPAGSIESATMGIGAADGALTFRLTVPSAQVKALAGIH